MCVTNLSEIKSDDTIDVKYYFSFYIHFITNRSWTRGSDINWVETFFLKVLIIIKLIIFLVNNKKEWIENKETFFNLVHK